MCVDNKMKTFLLIFSVFTVANEIFYVAADAALDMRLQAVDEYIRAHQELAQAKKAVENVCPGYGSRVEDVIRKSERCFLNIDDDEETICSSVKNHFLKCFQPIQSMFEECLPEKSKELPAFFGKAVVSVFKHVCSLDGEHIFELTNDCARNQNSRTARCIRRAQVKMSEMKTNHPGKVDLCSALQSMRGCVESHLTSGCGNKITRDSFIGVYDAMLSVCGDEQNAIDSYGTQSKYDTEWVNAS